MKIRIATYNIHKGVSSFGRRPRILALKQAIDAMGAELVFLQEVQGRHDLHAARHAQWPNQGQHAFLAGSSHHSAYGMNAVYDHGHHGNALLSRFGIAFSSNRDVSDHAFEQRGILHCAVQAPAAEVHCYVVHLGLFAAGRKRQTEGLIETIEASAPPGAPIIIAGDFNDWGNRLSAALQSRLGVTEVFDDGAPKLRLSDFLRRNRLPKAMPARTFPAGLPLLRLDRIYVRGFAVETAEVLHGALWAKLSDHAPIVATLRLT
ncbi:endonuclease/exonuclease/phosphatase family protein [Herminiimonas sp. CN]|uniref:endonuclease/exonuclease/phosphatase family protein n=1 Tax=Herminiimonas sp. CN TaxID=1349818 RepID=UPI00047413FA|nr:endonuclease/exonuclease/phosphatase family protein [Herminiimonas sp. CN]